MSNEMTIGTVPGIMGTVMSRVKQFSQEMGVTSKKGANDFDISSIAHPVDQAIVGVLECLHVADPLGVALDQVVSAQYGTLLATGIAVDEVNFPEVYEMLACIANDLGIAVPYTVVSSALPGINAFATGTDKKPFIVLSNQAPALLKPEELRFILAHECGHIAMEHMVYHTAGALASVLAENVPVIGPSVASIAAFPLSYWNRCSEVTADRIGLLACGDLEVAQRALLRLVGGLTSVDDVCIERYVSQSRALQERQFLGKFGEYFAVHPLMHKRIEALDAFAQPEPYYAASGKSVPLGANLFTKEQLDERVGEILQVL